MHTRVHLARLFAWAAWGFAGLDVLLGTELSLELLQVRQMLCQ
jgi:hypothetical protein